MTDLTKNLDYQPLIRILLQKTEEGKLLWQPTADERWFLAPAGGQQTFEIGRLESGYELLSRGADGGLLLSIERYAADAELPSERKEYVLLARLYDHAKRIARRIDENVESTLTLLEKL